MHVMHVGGPRWGWGRPWYSRSYGPTYYGSAYSGGASAVACFIIFGISIVIAAFAVGLPIFFAVGGGTAGVIVFSIVGAVMLISVVACCIGGFRDNVRENPLHCFIVTVSRFVCRINPSHLQSTRRHQRPRRFMRRRPSMPRQATRPFSKRASFLRRRRTRRRSTRCRLLLPSRRRPTMHISKRLTPVRLRFALCLRLTCCVGFYPVRVNEAAELV